jgi:hypothetical protein
LAWKPHFEVARQNNYGDVEHIAATSRHRDGSVRMADHDSPRKADETPTDDEELEEADEESFPASDPPATWSGPAE